MDRQIKRLSKLVQNLLDVARIAGGRLELQPEEFDLGELVRDVAQRFAARGGTTGWKLEVTPTAAPLRGAGIHCGWSRW